jgi:hypothetical protein
MNNETKWFCHHAINEDLLIREQCHTVANASEDRGILLVALCPYRLRLGELIKTVGVWCSRQLSASASFSRLAIAGRSSPDSCPLLLVRTRPSGTGTMHLRRAHAQTFLLLVLGSLLSVAHAANPVEVEVLANALTPALSRLADTIEEADWAAGTSEEAIARLYHFPWPPTKAKTSRQALDQEIEAIKGRIPKTPNKSEIRAVLDRERPLLKAGDRIEFIGSLDGQVQLIKGRIKAIRNARVLDGGHTVEAYVMLDDGNIWKKSSLPDEAKGRLFADERAKWLQKVVPRLGDRLSLRRLEAEKKALETIRELVRDKGFVMLQGLDCPRELRGTILTGSEAEALIHELAEWAKANGASLYQQRRAREERERQARALAARKAQIMAWQREQRRQRGLRAFEVLQAQVGRAAAPTHGGSLQDQMRRGKVTVPSWVKTPQDLQRFLDVVDEATTGR